MRRYWVSFPFFLVLAVWPGTVGYAQHSTGPNPPVQTWLAATLPGWNADTRLEASDALHGTFTLQGVKGIVPHTADGGLDWTWRGPNNDPEFAWFLNRHHHIPALYVAWRETKDIRYRTALNEQLRDWLKQNPRPAHYSFSSSWRALEVARRAVEAWLPVFFAPDSTTALDADVHDALLASFTDHALALRDNHSFSGNHLITEMTGLAAIALAFPYNKDAPVWLDYALAQSQSELAREIYPDGAEKELSNLYQQVALLEFQKLADLLNIAGRTSDAAKFKPALENAWNYYAHTLDPTGHGPLNNDSSIEDDATLVQKMAEVYQRPDWLYIATQGKSGTVPSDSPMEYFPYAGLAVMRSGWGSDSQWAFFEMGPRGTDHQHADRLHLSIGGYGREFLVDDGRYNYQPGPWRDYFTGPQGHNVLLLDGQGTFPPPDSTDAPVNVRHEISSDHALFLATAPFSGDALAGQGPAYHTRTVYYSSDHYWLVVDRVLCIGPHEIETLWHFYPDCIVKRAANLIYTDNPGKANLGLLALTPPSSGWNIDLITGRESPDIQGWYSPSFNVRVPATCTSFSTKINSPSTTIWLIWIAPPGQSIASARPNTVEALARLPQLGLEK
jgi:hypothetical protein